MKRVLVFMVVFFMFYPIFGQDFDEIKKSAEQGDAKAQYILGILYDFGEGTLKDKKQAAYWVKKSYENGFEQAKIVWRKLKLWKY